MRTIQYITLQHRTSDGSVRLQAFPEIDVKLPFFPSAGNARIDAARKGLCKQSLALLMVEWRAHRHVHENYNSTTGIGCDVDSSNPFYHWGANLGYIAMRETML